MLLYRTCCDNLVDLSYRTLPANMPRHKRHVRTIDVERLIAYEQQGSQDGQEGAIGALHTHEQRWVTYYEYLLEKGYQLRPRFRPGWVHSWKDTNIFPADCEDAWSRNVSSLVSFLLLSLKT